MGVNIRKIIGYRKMNNLTQKQVALSLNLSNTAYSSKELGKVDFTSAEVGKLANLFGIDPGDLYNTSNELK